MSEGKKTRRVVYCGTLGQEANFGAGIGYCRAGQPMDADADVIAPLVKDKVFRDATKDDEAAEPVRKPESKSEQTPANSAAKKDASPAK